MLRLTLLRHAKSSWAYMDIDDFFRPLNQRGYRQISGLAQGLPQDIDTLWCSPAIRAYTTAQGLFIECPSLRTKLELKPTIYAASASELLIELQQAKAYKHIAIIGHNPSLESLASQLCGTRIVMKTAHLALIDLQCDSWVSLEPGCGTLKQLWRHDNK